MALPQMQMLNLPQIDAAVQQHKQAQFQNAMAPYLMQRAQHDMEMGQLEMQATRDQMARAAKIREELAAQSSQGAPMQSAGAEQQSIDPRSRQAEMLRRQAEVYFNHGDVDTANKLHEQALKLEPEYSQTPQYDQQGRAFVMNKQGQPKYLEGISARDKIISDDMGGQRVYRTEFSADPVAAANKTQTPDSIASNAISIRGQNMVDARAQQSNALKREEIAAGGKPPPGYRFTPDGTGLEAIPGGPADIKAGELGAKREKSQQAAVAQADRVISKVDQALGKVGILSAGKGSVLSNIPGTDAKDLQTDLETVKANLGFAELQAMRDASPTGGALGAIAVQELTALQATVASLDQAQSPDQLKKNLGEIRRHYTNWKTAVTRANGQQGGESSNAGGESAPSKPSTGTIVDGFRFLGGNPADPKRWMKVGK